MAYAEVQNQFNRATSLASSASGKADSFIGSLNAIAGGLQMPEVNLDVEWPQAPEIAAPLNISIDAPSVSFPYDYVGFAPSPPAIVLTPETLPAAPVLPEYSYEPGAMPEKPELQALSPVVLPDGPEAWAPPTMPALLSINVTPFGGVDMHTDWINRLNEVPDDLVLAAPTPYEVPSTPRYDSALLQDMISLLRQRAQGGTGLNPVVEQAIWDRGRSREAGLAEARVAEVVKNAEARGFALPSGAMHAQLREVQKEVLAKAAELSRDVMIKQAELEQENAKHVLEHGIQLEGRLIEYTNNVEQRVFDSAKFLASNAIEIYNAIVSKYRMVLEKYSTYAGIYRSLIEAEKSKVDAYRATVDAERAKADINQSLIAQLRAQIDIRNSHIALYRAELEAVQTVVSVDKLKIEAFGERVRAYTAEINAETSKVEAFKARIQSNVARSDVYKNQVDAFAAASASAAATARAKAEVYESNIRGFQANVQSYATRVSAESEKIRTQLGVQNLKVEVGRLNVMQNTSDNQLQIENYKALLTQYEAAKQLALTFSKLLSENYFALKGIVTDAAKVGAQVNAQMAASAYGTLHASAAISGADSTSTNFSYSGDTSDTRAAPNG